MLIDKNLIASLAEKIVQARKLYGSDSAYVIGLFNGFEWLLEGFEEKENTKQLLRNLVLEYESGKAVAPAEEATEEREETLSENSWIKGVVKWFNNDKGYGFISTDGNIDVFVHWRDISSWDRSIAQGEEVEFMVTKTAKGFQAVNVMKAGQQRENVEASEKKEHHDSTTETEPPDPSVKKGTEGDSTNSMLDGAEKAGNESGGTFEGESIGEGSDETLS